MHSTQNCDRKKIICFENKKLEKICQKKKPPKKKLEKNPSSVMTYNMEKPWRLFTYQKLFKCPQIPHSSPRVTSTSNRNALNYSTSLSIRLKESSRTPGVTLGILGLTSIPHSLDQRQKQKD